MPYSSLKDAPNSWKTINGAKLTLAQVNWISNVYDNALSQYKDKSKAAAVAMSAFKNSHKKKGDKWVKEELKFKQLNFTLQEAEFDDDAKTATVTIIKEGWSLNSSGGRRRYYTAQAVEDVSKLLSESRKMYGNHSDKSKNRGIEEWTATIESSNVEGSNAKAKIVFEDNPNWSWLYGAAKRNPSEVGISISGEGAMKVGEMQGKPAAIVERITVLDSADFVTRPAAGGQVDIAEAIETIEKGLVQEAIDSLNTRIERIKKMDLPYVEMQWLLGAVTDFIYDVVYSDSDDVKKDISAMVTEFETKLNKVVKNMKSRFKEEIIKEKNMDLKQLREEHPEDYKILNEQITVVAEHEAEKKWKEKNDKAEKDLKEAQDENKKLKEDSQKQAIELEKYKKEEEIKKKKQFVAEQLEENKIADKVTDSFKEILYNESDEEKIKLLVLEQANFIKDVEGKINNPPKKTKVKEENSDFANKKDERKKRFLSN